MMMISELKNTIPVNKDQVDVYAEAAKHFESEQCKPRLGRRVGKVKELAMPYGVVQIHYKEKR